MFIRFTTHVFRERLSVCVCVSFPFDSEGLMSDRYYYFLVIAYLFTFQLRDATH